MWRDLLLNPSEGFVTDDKLVICCEVSAFVEFRYLNLQALKLESNIRNIPIYHVSYPIQIDIFEEIPHRSSFHQLGCVSQSWTHTEMMINKFSHLWTIDNYSHQSEQDGHRFPILTSEKFGPSNHPSTGSKFILAYYPRGDFHSNGDYTAVYLTLSSRAKSSTRVCYQIYALNDRMQRFGPSIGMQNLVFKHRVFRILT